MRKHTRDWYLQFLRQHDTVEFRQELQAYVANTVSNIKGKKGRFIETLHQYEGFWMITTYSMDKWVAIQINIIRPGQGESFYSRKWSVWGAYLEENFTYGKFNYSFGCSLNSVKKYAYAENLKDLLVGTQYNYSQIWDLARNIDFSLRYYLLYCNKYIHIIECLTKLKLYNLAKDIVYGRIGFNDKENIIKTLGLANYKELTIAIENNFGFKDLLAYRKFRSTNIDFKYFKKIKGYFNNDYHHSFSHISDKALFNYYIEQTQRKKYKYTYSTFIVKYRDYINACKFLNYNLDDTMYSKPFDFQAMHDRTTELQLLNTNKELYSEADKQFKKFKKYIYSNEEFAICVPKNALAIIKEGRELGHCVGSFISRVADGSSVILFLRSILDLSKSYYTIEINPKTDKIVQCYGYKNKQPTADISKFLEQFKKKKLAEAS